MPVTVADLPAYTDIIDVRSPGEFSEDHIPGAVNLPVLDDAERERVGTLYKQISSFEAKKVGAALVSRNIAKHLDAWFIDKPKSYRPLVYCWRGGSRSGSLTHVLQKIGFGAVQLEGGYKAYRRHVVAELDREALAAHRGSLLGALPDQPQPSQKSFESAIWFALSRFDSAHPVFVESESKKIGALRVPDALITAMRASICLRLEVPLAARVRLLTEDYMHFLHDPGTINRQLAYLTPLRGNETVATWQTLANERAWPELVTALLDQHYDPTYLKSLAKNYAASPSDQLFHTDDLSASGLQQLARTILAAA
ncbi:MAG: tRNA 2-selenouridine(34) synthase MnmH [Thiobacillus sp. SCN 63-57]|uniref:tRNA 2-selenouridine(34) synthase MnmH n=1 Tax=Thiobacillus sp. SCN 63-57 TaxID=1660145 RepID=UPI0008696A67|nr:tRNA 2-selenouridine(34) synthase MnmH [Thiobacillus sp. SCN 63-57]ODU99352.1 MAG: tRNA 2-selenouridine(34) synthase MnmH [Thiobacillus sp. SCN 63-57]